MIGLEERILALTGVRRSEQQFHIGESILIDRLEKDQLRLHLTQACLEKLETALKSEDRALEVNTDDRTVTLQFQNDVDREFVFLYVRYAWKYWRGTQSQAA